MKLYSYYRSSAAYRVRIALNLKHIEHQIIPVNLLKKEQGNEDYIQKQPQGLVPCLETADGQHIAQSGAIISYLDATYPSCQLMPSEPLMAAKIRSFVDIIACDIHPICNLRVTQYLTNHQGASEKDKIEWYKKWINAGFEALESLLEQSDYCFLAQPTMADIYLVPQVYNALRFNLDMSEYPGIMDIYQHCMTQPAFIQASPEKQIDAV